MEAREGNNGLTVKVNLWPAEECAQKFGVENTRLWITGVITSADTGEAKHFKNPEELIAILDKWNLTKWGVEP